MTLGEHRLGVFRRPYWTAELLLLRLEAAVDLMKFLGFVWTAAALWRKQVSGEGDWVLDWLYEGKEERRGKSRTMI